MASFLVTRWRGRRMQDPATSEPERTRERILITWRKLRFGARRSTMRLLRTDTDCLQLEVFNDERRLPKYAILSHTWLADNEEILFAELESLGLASKKGWQKVAFARRQAWKDELEYVWIDTCCIDKSSSAELSEAINSMYRWYGRAEVCYVYLEDMPSIRMSQSSACPPVGRPHSAAKSTRDLVSALPLQNSEVALGADLPESHVQVRSEAIARPAVSHLRDGDLETPLLYQPEAPNHDRNPSFLGDCIGELTQASHVVGDVVRLEEYADVEGLGSTTSDDPYFRAFRNCRWFARGWTLQEMIANPNLQFYDSCGNPVGTLVHRSEWVAAITHVHLELLKGERSLGSFSIAQRMSWASARTTTRIEDRAYSLLGIFGISMPVIYGEGDRAFQRLQEELLHTYSDQTIFTWGLTPRQSEDSRTDSSKLLLATSPDCFRGCGSIIARPRERQHREYEIIGTAIRFETSMFYVPKDFTSRPNYKAMLSCCFENDRTRSIVLHLTRLSSGRYFRSAIGICDIYSGSKHCSPCSIEILRDTGDLATRIRDERHHTVLCRCTPESAIYSARIVEGEGTVADSHEDVAGRARSIAPDLWDKSGQSFILPGDRFTIHRSKRILFRGRLSLHTGPKLHKVCAEVIIYPVFEGNNHELSSHYWKFTTESPVEIQFSQSKKTIGARLNILLGLPIMKLQEGFLIGTYGKMSTVHDEYLLIEFDIQSTPRTLWTLAHMYSLRFVRALVSTLRFLAVGRTGVVFAISVFVILPSVTAGLLLLLPGSGDEVRFWPGLLFAIATLVIGIPGAVLYGRAAVRRRHERRKY